MLVSQSSRTDSPIPPPPIAMPASDTDILLITALPMELGHDKLPDHVRVVYCGVGKINATMATLHAIRKFAPARILNFGTAGGINAALSGLVDIARVVQRDMIAEPLIPRGRVPFCERPHELLSGRGVHTCGTGDSFVTSHDPWLHKQQIDVVDMELFAIAAVAHDHGIPWMSFKYITDGANDAAGDDWHARVSHGEALFLAKLRELA